MFYIYIIYSAGADKFYIGYSSDPYRRLIEHNTKPFNTFTSKYRPWVLKAVFRCGENEGTAIHIERLLKKQKNRVLIEKLCDPDFVPTGILAQLPACRQAGLESHTCGINQRVSGSSPEGGADTKNSL